MGQEGFGQKPWPEEISQPALASSQVLWEVKWTTNRKGRCRWKDEDTICTLGVRGDVSLADELPTTDWRMTLAASIVTS